MFHRRELAGLEVCLLTRLYVALQSPVEVAFAAIVAHRHSRRWSGRIKMATSATYLKNMKKMVKSPFL